MSSRSFLSAIFAIMLVSTYVSPLFSYAQTADELQSNLNSLSAQIQALDKEIADFNKKITNTQGEAKTLKAALASLELRRSALVKQIDRTKLMITDTQIHIVDTQGKISQTTVKLTRNQSALAETLRSLVYADNGMPAFMGVLSNGSHLSDAIDVIKRGTDASHAINQKVDELASTKEELDTQKQTFESSKKTLESLSAALTDQQLLVDQTAKEKNQLLIQTKNKETEYQKLLADRKKKKGELEAEVLDVESKLKVITDVSKLPRIGRGVLEYPLANVIITQYFGNTPFASQNPQVYNGSGHNGVDFGTKVGTSILAAGAGTVVGTGNTDAACSGVSYGKWVLIRHANGLTTLYAHLSVIQVSAGQAVTAGQKIGLSGNTGYSTGPHLHFTVYASDSVHIAGPTEYKSKVCGTYMILPLAPRSGYLNPLSYL